MNLMRYFFLPVFFLLAVAAYAQTAPPPGMESTPNSRNPSVKHESKVFAPRQSKAFQYKKVKVTHTARYEFYEQIEKAAKQKQRVLKKLAKPRYSNRLYFGHKHKPKKRPPHKMRYCEQCGIRH
jgi:hypothetical protein